MGLATFGIVHPVFLALLQSEKDKASTPPSTNEVDKMIQEQQRLWLKPRIEHLEIFKGPSAEKNEKIRILAEAPLEKNWEDFLIDNFRARENEAVIFQSTLRAVEHLEQQNITDKIAIDLGSGYSPMANYLLEKGWKVIVVDNAPYAIDKCNELYQEHVKSGRLTTVNCKMEEFTFPKNVTLITANDSLNYCEPAQLGLLLDKINQALAPNGLFAGNFFVSSDRHQDIACRGILNGWYVEEIKNTSRFLTVQKLLESHNFNTASNEETPQNCLTHGFAWGPTINFVASKTL
ncbi:MAG: class I SAM-dependent methyltransferase [Chlamydiota bacterium]|nr:class I SAM-dependent methyltransferase [Chlamydiota bacterium]